LVYFGRGPPRFGGTRTDVAQDHLNSMKSRRLMAIGTLNKMASILGSINNGNTDAG
jgi:hypothetical protein